MDQNKINEILRIAKMHYELKMSQVEIAKAENLSKSTVNRLIKSASDLGFVEVRIIEPKHSYTDLETELIKRFSIRKAVIVPDVVHNQEVLTRDVCSALADDLPRYIENNSIIGVAWGHTLSTLINQLPNMRRTGVKVIQLNGGFSKAIYDTGAMSIVKSFVDNVSGEGMLLPAPAIVDNTFIADAIRTDSQITRILAMAKQCQTAIYSVGTLSRHSVLYEMGCFTDDEYEELKNKGALGDICSHYINVNGEISDEALDSRVIATPLTDIKAIPNKLLIAVGVEKAKAVKACLTGGLVDCLYIDQPTVQEILSL